MKTLTLEHRQKLSEAKKRNPPKNLFGFGAVHPRWTGDTPTYQGVHKWLYREFGKATKCEYDGCVYPRKNALGTILLAPKRFDWANRTGLYRRYRSDWIMLCPSCHAKFDRDLIKIK